MTTPLSEVREDAFLLYGLTRALRVLQDGAGPDMRDGTAALIEVVYEKAGALALRIDGLDSGLSSDALETIHGTGGSVMPCPELSLLAPPMSVSDAA